jgi:hypothetical protein
LWAGVGQLVTVVTRIAAMLEAIMISALVL